MAEVAEHNLVSTNRPMTPHLAYTEGIMGLMGHVRPPHWVGNVSTGVGPPVIDPIIRTRRDLMLRTTVAQTALYNTGQYIDVGAPAPAPVDVVPNHAGDRGTRALQAALLDHPAQAVNLATDTVPPVGRRVDRAQVPARVPVETVENDPLMLSG